MSSIGNRKLTRNVWVTLANTLVSGILLYLLYRYLLQTIGVEKVGVWSIVMASTSLSRIGGLGFGGSVLKFVAKYLAVDNLGAIRRVVETATITVAVLILLLLIVVYWPLDYLLAHVVATEEIDAARELLPYAMLSLWLSTMVGIAQASFEGLHRFDIPAVANIAAGSLYFAFVVVLVPGFGLMGLAYAQVLQVFIVWVSLWYLLRNSIPGLPWLPWRWERRYFIEMFRYGVNFQVGSLVQMLLEPSTKLLMGKFGGLAMVGYFEMANRMVVQFRAILVSVNRIAIPIIADLKENNENKIVDVYRFSFRILMFLSLLLYLGIVAVSPSISRLWIGHYQAEFVYFSVVLSVGWMVNTMSGPSYMGNLGSGELKYNTLYHVVSGILNLVFGLILGRLFGGYGVAIAFAMSIAIASVLLIYRYQMKHRVSISGLHVSENILLLTSACIGAASAWFYFDHSSGKQQSLLLLLGSALIYGALVAVPAWLHRVRRELLGNRLCW